MENNEQKIIELLIKEGYTVLQVITPDGERLYFIVYRWQEGYFNTAQSIDFNTVEGVNITDFIKKHGINYNNYAMFMAAFNKAVDEAPMIRCEFTKEVTWYKWSSITKARN